MRGGTSGCKGFIIYDTDKTGKNAVYGYYQGEKIVYVMDEFSELTKLKDLMEEEFDRPDKMSSKIFVGTMLAVFLLSILSFVKLSFLKGVFMTAILVLAFKPMVGAIFAHINLFDTEEHRNQFRRFHGCEHKILNILLENKEASEEELKAASIYHMECGSMYVIYKLVLLAVLAIVGLNISTLGLLKGALILVGTGLVILVNIIKNIGIFNIFQRNSVAEPTEREYILALELLKKFKEL